MASGSGWNLWVWLVGVVVRRYIDFLILLIPTPLVSALLIVLFSFLFLYNCICKLFNVIMSGNNQFYHKYFNHT